MRRTSAILILAAASLAGAACSSDPDPGSEADCTPAAAPAGIADETPPLASAELQAWLAAGDYQGFLAESARHPSSGPHGPVRTYVNAALAGSLATCEASHPVGSAAVKELYTGDAIRGWAVMIKTEAAQGAASWYWYEVFDTAPGAEPAVAGQAHDTCTGCHDGGLDAVRSSWPLR